MGQFFHLKTLHSYSKCTLTPVCPRQQKSEDELVVVRATPLCPAEVFKLMVAKQKKKEEKKLQESQNMLQNAKKHGGSNMKLTFEDDDEYSQGSSLGSNSHSRLHPISRAKHRNIQRKSLSPIDKSRYSKARNISPLKKEMGLGCLTMQEARYKYKQIYPADHPPEILARHHNQATLANNTKMMATNKNANT